MQVSNQHILESFTVCHNLLYNQITRFSNAANNQNVDEKSIDYCLQSAIHQNMLRSKYPPNKLYVTTQPISGATSLDLSAMEGTLVAVIKNNDPMGNVSRWFVDSGIMKGFVESRYLKLSEEASLTENSSATVPQKESPVNLMSLDSPVKEVKKSSFQSSPSQSSLYSNLSDDSEGLPSYENIANINMMPRPSSDEVCVRFHTYISRIKYSISFNNPFLFLSISTHCMTLMERIFPARCPLRPVKLLKLLRNTMRRITRNGGCLKLAMGKEAMCQLTT